MSGACPGLCTCECMYQMEKTAFTVNLWGWDSGRYLLKIDADQFGVL